MFFVTPLENVFGGVTSGVLSLSGLLQGCRFSHWANSNVEGIRFNSISLMTIYSKNGRGKFSLPGVSFVSPLGRFSSDVFIPLFANGTKVVL